MSNDGMWLEIRRGKTNFPLRPITGDRFLIGAGSHCHLQLGGQNCPLLHSLLLIEGTRATLEAVVADPPLLINGEARRTVDLRDEDRVEIGDFEFVFHKMVRTEPSVQAASVMPFNDQGEAIGIAALSVPQLVQQIEEEQEQIDTFEIGREGGAAALLGAALCSLPQVETPALSISSFRPETTLSQLTEFLRAQSRSLAEQDAVCQRRAAALHESQAALAQQIAEMANAVARWEETTVGASRRVSA